MSDQHDRIHHLEAQVASLTDKLESLVANDHPAARPSGTGRVPASQVETGPPTGSRRNLLKLAAGAAAGGAVVAVSGATGRVAAEPAGALNLIAPVRVYDSREDQEPLDVTKGPLSPGENRAVDCTVNGSGVPADATGVVLNLTAADPVDVGNLAVYPDGTEPPSISTLNYRPGENIANSTISGCGPGATIRVQCGPTGVGATDFVVDISGYYL